MAMINQNIHQINTMTDMYSVILVGESVWLSQKKVESLEYPGVS